MRSIFIILSFLYWYKKYRLTLAFENRRIFMDQLKSILKKHQHSFAPLVNFNQATDRILRLNFSATNADLKEYYISDTNWFTLYIKQTLLNAGARYGIGGYGEDRILYKRFKQFDGEEQRSIHLGTDIWCDEGTKIFAPLGGMVHSYAFNAREGDYGATIILQHQLDMVSFYTLYGHISLVDIGHLRKGMVITRGECFAHFGNAAENGNWPPHLHFQIIEDIRFQEGDYPGVCKPSEKEKYMANCPDADLIADMEQWL
jgi:peptidoglycan LD-endopeptidase LytH